MERIMRALIFTLAIIVPLSVFSGGLSPGQKAADKHNGISHKEKPLTIYQNNNDGRFLVLSNGETWEVYKKDTDHSGGWIGGELVISKEDGYRRSGSKYFRYKIYNKATNDSVWARLISRDD